METYSDFFDVQSQLPFTLDENSLPTLLDWVEIKSQAYRMINAIIGGPKTADDNLKLVEIELTVDYCLALHTGRPAKLRLTELHRIILDNYLEEGLVSSGDFYYGYD